MWQGMFRKRGRPEQLQIAGYDQPIPVEQRNPIPVHQSLVPFDHCNLLGNWHAMLPSKIATMSNQVNNNQIVVSDVPRQDDMLAIDPEQVMSPKPAILDENQGAAWHFEVPNLPFSQEQRN